MCVTPHVADVNWKDGVCPIEGEKWSPEQIEKRTCTVQCHKPAEQQVVLNCIDGVVTVDPESKPCEPTAFWEVEQGACSVTCGSGVYAINYRCSTGNEEDCKLIGQCR